MASGYQLNACPSTPHNIQFANSTPITVKTSLEASDERAAKRKADFELESEAKRRKAEASGAPFTSPTPVKNKGGRPRSINPVKKIPTGPTILRTSNPVKTVINMDAWRCIFEFCPVDFLLNARKVCSGFREALSGPNIWQTARFNTLGPTHPACPPQLTEMQYADLLTGLGCQSRGCGNKKARKTYWAFERRWCESCLHQNVLDNEGADKLLASYAPHYRHCVPQAVFDSWKHYQWVGTPQDMPSWARPQAFTAPGYLVSALNTLKAEADAFTAPAADGTVKDQTEISAFFQTKRTANDKKVETLKAVEDWEKEEEKKRNEWHKVVKAQRADFYADMAAKMDEPIERAELEVMDCFKRAVNINRPATERSWKLLEDKIKKEKNQPTNSFTNVMGSMAANDPDGVFHDAMEYPPRNRLPASLLMFLDSVT